ncbi:unnamed protein product [Phytophthora fragariaefolia]|uniref:Unnamed protein product n=1 Tax=Phytophthora fragariaefolia TaxID=1490495 RepID=A0A9W6TS12_9STRA|nr:unnamed protein product [Phytophthora fragariaefolia]
MISQTAHPHEVLHQLPRTPIQQQRDVRVALKLVDKLAARQKLRQIWKQLHDLLQPAAENRKRSRQNNSLMLQPPQKKSRYTCSPVRVAEELTASCLPARDLIKYVPLKPWSNIDDEGTGRVLGVTYWSLKLNARVIDLTNDLDECGLTVVGLLSSLL